MIAGTAISGTEAIVTIIIAITKIGSITIEAIAMVIMIIVAIRVIIIAWATALSITIG
jgi:hypothetical protein